MKRFVAVGCLSIALLACLAMQTAASAADPYFVPYGAHRGRIHIGPRHARIRWGGGVTPYGAAVLMHGFDVAGSVGRAYFGGGDGGGGGTADDASSVGSESTAEHEAQCQDQLRKTRELLEETKRACGLEHPVAPEASAEPGAEPDAPLPDYSRIEAVKREVAESLPLIAELQKVTAERKQAAEEFEQVLARDRRAFEAFLDVYKTP